MGAQEQGEVGTTLETELQGLGPLLRRFEERFRIQLSPQAKINGSALVNPFDSSLVVADGVRERRTIRKDKIESSNAHEAVLHGLAAFLDITRGHAAPRDDIDYDQGGLNRIGDTFLALQEDGAIVSSVGPNSLMDLKGSTKQLWAVDPIFWATLHGTPQKVRDAHTTQYTARYHSPQMVRALLEAQLEWLLANPRELRKLGDPEARLAAQKRVLEEQFFPRLQREFERKQFSIHSTHKPQITDITASIDRLIPDMPPDIITHHDDYKILGFYVANDQLDQLPNTGTAAYVTLEARRYVSEDNGTATAVRLERVPVTLAVERTDAAFSGKVGTLTLPPCIHSDAGNEGGRTKFNLFVQMTSASNPNSGFHPSGAAGSLFEKEGGFVAVGHKVHAIVARDIIDQLVENLRESHIGGELESQITPNWVIGWLVEKGYIAYVDSSKLHDATKTADLTNALAAKMDFDLRSPRTYAIEPGSHQRHERVYGAT
jgi:hypothetical protein